MPVAAGQYKGATQNGDYVFLTVLPNRTVTGFRVNNVTEHCNGGLRLTGGINWSNNASGSDRTRASPQQGVLGAARLQGECRVD